MFPWNQQIYLLTNGRPINHFPSSFMYNRHHGGIYLDLVRTNQRNTSETQNPLLILQDVGEAKEARARYSIFYKRLIP